MMNFWPFRKTTKPNIEEKAEDAVKAADALVDGVRGRRLDLEQLVEALQSERVPND